MARFRLIGLIELQNTASHVYLYANTIKNLEKYTRYFMDFPLYLVIEKPVCEYFLKNKDKYLFIKESVYIYIVDKKYALSNMDLFYKNSTKEFYRFIKYHLIKEKLLWKAMN